MAKSVVIIGSGASGLSAAKYLSENSAFEITILEANPDRYGGRIWTFQHSEYPDKPVELGAMWLHGGGNQSHPIRAFCDSHGIETTVHDATLDPSMVVGYDSEGKIFSAQQLSTTTLLMETIETRRLELIAQGDLDLTLPKALKIKRHQDLDVIKAFRSKVAQEISIPVIEAYNGASLKELSTLLYEGTPNSTTHVNYGPGDRIIPSGYSKFLDQIVADSQGKFNLKLGSTVKKIKLLDNGKVELKVRKSPDPDTHTMTVDYVIVTVSLGVLKADLITFKPPLPSAQRKAIKRTGFGNLAKVLLVFDSPFWPDKEHLLIGTENPHGFPFIFVNLHRIHGLPALLAMLSPKAADAADKMSEDIILPKVLAALENIVGRKAMETHTLKHAKITRWRSDPLFLGAYSYARHGQKIADTYNLRKPFNSRVFFAGEHTEFPEGQFGTVHAAYSSGIRAAKEILNVGEISNTATKGGIPLVNKIFSNVFIALIVTLIMIYF